MSAEIGGLNQPGLTGKTVAEIHPGKSAEKEAAQIIEPHPQHRCSPEQQGKRLITVSIAAGHQAERKSKSCRKAGHIGGKQGQGRQGKPPGQSAVAPKHNQNPIEEGEVIEQAADKSHKGAAAGSRGKHSQQQGYQGDEKQGPPADLSGHRQGEEAGGDRGGEERRPFAVNLAAEFHRS